MTPQGSKYVNSEWMAFYRMNGSRVSFLTEREWVSSEIEETQETGEPNARVDPESNTPVVKGQT